MGAPRSPCALGSLLCCCLLSVVLAQRVNVQDEVTGYVGQEVTLPCTFTNASPDVKVSQVTWVKETGTKKQNVAVYHPVHGPSYLIEKGTGRIRFRAPSLQDATLVIAPLHMSDEGIYTCEFATYPLGNEDGVTSLTILAKPTNFAEALEVKAGNTEVPVAACTSANGKPAAHITWQSGLNGNFTVSEVTNTNGTVTVTSHYVMVPTKEANEQRIFCHIDQKTLVQPEALLVTLSILYPPEVVIHGYDNNWYLNRDDAVLTCSATGNPPPTDFSWTTPSGQLPNTVAVKGERLVVRNVDASVNTTFICHATNRVGRVSSEQVIFVRDKPNTEGAGTTGGIIGGLIAAIVALAVVATGILICRQQRNNRREEEEEDLEGPPAYKPPPPSQMTEEREPDAPRYHELPTMEEREAVSNAAPSPEDGYLDQVNPIYDALAFAATEEEAASAALATDKAFIMSRAMYV
ncbi:nectin-2 isoform X3 [Eublepharis macularius]|uniref:Nectin-2 isoform X3 n=1 Tax=Eublepharis macularius TaxID=481883 RepID=A0AA97KGR6_EUBMA|nr:nectin-2 isoform X3 [Eublepharis macularius]